MTWYGSKDERGRGQLCSDSYLGKLHGHGTTGQKGGADLEVRSGVNLVRKSDMSLV